MCMDFFFRSFCVFRLASQHHKFFLKLRVDLTPIPNLAEGNLINFIHTYSLV